MKNIILVLLILSSNSFSALNPGCKTLQRDLSELFQEISYEKGLACIYTSKNSANQVTISFFEKNKNSLKKIAENNTFITLQDIQMNQMFLDKINGNRFQLVQSFPRDNYEVELQYYNHTIKVIAINKTIKLNSTIDQVPIYLSFSIKSEILKSISFDKLDQEKSFSPKNLELSQSSHGKKIPITAEKSIIFNAPKLNKISRLYLIKGDKVILLDASAEWLKIRYTNKDRSIERWIRISDIL